MMRFLAEQIVNLPLSVGSRLLETYDVLMLLCPLLEAKPWEHRSADGTLRRFVQGQWVVCSEADRRAMAKSEAQVRLSPQLCVSPRQAGQSRSPAHPPPARPRRNAHPQTCDGPLRGGSALRYG